MKANANPYTVHGGNYFKNIVLQEIISSNNQKQKFPSKNGITLTRNVLLPGSLSSIRLLSLSSHIPLLSRGGTRDSFKPNNIQLFCQVLIFLLTEEQKALVNVTTVQEAPEAVCEVFWTRDSLIHDRNYCT